MCRRFNVSFSNFKKELVKSRVNHVCIERIAVWSVFVTFPKTNLIDKSFPLRQILSLGYSRLYFICALPFHGLFIWNVASWNCYQESVVCLASRDPYQASCSRSQSVNASKTLNKRQEDSWSRLSQLLENANLWESFTWTMKHALLDWGCVKCNNEVWMCH